VVPHNKVLVVHIVHSLVGPEDRSSRLDLGDMGRIPSAVLVRSSHSRIDLVVGIPHCYFADIRVDRQLGGRHHNNPYVAHPTAVVVYVRELVTLYLKLGSIVRMKGGRQKQDPTSVLPFCLISSALLYLLNFCQGALR